MNVSYLYTNKQFMKKALITLALLVMTGAAVSAQENPATEKGQKMKNASPEEKAKNGANHAEKKLGLTADQKSKWEVAALARIQANEPHRTKLKGSTTPEERKQIHASVKENNKKFDDTVNGFLTAEQKTKWEAQKKEHREKRKAKVKGKKAPDELDLDLED